MKHIKIVLVENKMNLLSDNLRRRLKTEKKNNILRYRKWQRKNQKKYIIKIHNNRKHTVVSQTFNYKICLEYAIRVSQLTVLSF